MGEPLTAIVKPTHGCNFSCSYCYLEEEAENGVMSDETLKKMTEELAKNQKEGHCSIIWHGGEPLIVGLDFFERALYYQWLIGKQEECKFDNGIQTNGSLINQEVIDFCKRQDVGLGFSLDGPRSTHDETRPYRNGESSFDDVTKGIRRACDAGLGGGFIVVLNKKNINHLDEIYGFIKEIKVNAKINPLIRSGKADLNYDELGITPREYADAMIHLFDMYFHDREFTSRLDPFDTLIGNVSLEMPYGCCTFKESCQDTFVSIGPRGDVYPCGRFDGVTEMRLGNINQTSLSEILQSDLRKNLQTIRGEYNDECKVCEYVPICNSGCLSNGYMRQGNFLDRDYYCAGYKKMFNHIKKAVDIELSKAEVK
ncbi:MAG: radical SAM protein [Candidatus Woesearchaeota archaeon]|jgi:uncharacterized protein|nr:radical SAM protein [Candidatus Woesearchaeota archaeon]